MSVTEELIGFADLVLSMFDAESKADKSETKENLFRQARFREQVKVVARSICEDYNCKMRSYTQQKFSEFEKRGRE